MLSVGFALAAAFCNACASVLQRTGARDVPPKYTMRPALLLALVRQPVWLFGLLAMTGGFVFQAGALDHGDLALVQPLLLTELPITLLLAGMWFKAPVERRAWFGVAGICAGLALGLLAAAPSGGRSRADTWPLVLMLLAGTGLTALGVVIALRFKAATYRAASFAAAAGVGFALTAALMKTAANQLTAHSVGDLVTSWQLYGMIAAGMLSLFIWQNALQAGTLAAAQPAITFTDPVVATAIGVLVFGEHIRLGPWLIAEFAGAAIVVLGSIELARSPLITGRPAGTEPERPSRSPTAQPANPSRAQTPGQS